MEKYSMNCKKFFFYNPLIILTSTLDILRTIIHKNLCFLYAGLFLLK